MAEKAVLPARCSVFYGKRIVLTIDAGFVGQFFGVTVR